LKPVSGRCCRASRQAGWFTDQALGEDKGGAGRTRARSLTWTGWNAAFQRYCVKLM